ncbi:anti-sigma factor [Agrobacterium vitis]|uniref:Anti-sigma factor n=1 Tax=Agrobacterium vitis TaxID=373 RepID=A0A368NNG9_AGRVI|nr:anti-sigma factor [Agrobacterium vitis]KAA3506471.1 anti-sigma factor [Agrobacterium vitis]KAA3520940.1 anti-sigma factor [Agrobacterium vitis]MCE6076962.1 anti-sigma factor [Agrobacterium vitis]MCF1469296.1 anti-sigma factor [Agrobacterium vitis]MCF1479838.1 anti-sigma factor [Agrobacterium vitis]
MSYDRKDIAHLADEYVLGLLEPTQAEEIEDAMEGDPELKAAIAASRDRFLPLDTSMAPQPVSEDLWNRIEASLSGQDNRRAKSNTHIANDNGSRRWKLAALTSLAASLLLTVGLVYSLTRTMEPLVVAVLVNEAGEVQAVVEDFGNDEASVRLLTDFVVPRDKTIQVWTLPSRDVGPVPLGLLEGVRSARLHGPTLPKPRNDQLYELTLEQAGGSPTGRPTGPILAKGFARIPR